ncbi:MAG: hypothetical protein KA184_15425 [Candidatus Hydrogenedentes bacterium]|nr:hypothetical protein [Candidatus Hydrogenedentota bacterium]
MTSRERMVAALERRTPDRLPVTTHHVMPYYLDHYLGGVDAQVFFERFGLDPILWTGNPAPNCARGEYRFPELGGHVVSDAWHISREPVPGTDSDAFRYCIETPGGTLTAVVQHNEHTTWLLEPVVKEKSDIDILAEHMTHPVCDVEAVNRDAAAFGERGLVRGGLLCFDLFGQPGCWQDAACLVGVERLIMETFHDPEWVHALLQILKARKLDYIRSMRGAAYDICELGGGDASSTVISPGLFREFVAPYDAELIAAAHAAGLRVVYHTCGGMMPILQDIAAMGPDAMETFTPPGMGGDTRLDEAKRRIGDRTCMIGGFDQFHFFKDCTPERTRAEVRRCFAEAGEGGGFILSPSDHFFDADSACLEAYGAEARRCVY